MKKIFILVLLCLTANCLKAQYSNGVVTDYNSYYQYVGSLSSASNNLSNAQKIKVDVFGGYWSADASGETTYYIGNRDGLRINRVTLGSSNGDIFTLKAFDNGQNNIDFYIVNSSWSAFAVKSIILNGPTSVNQFINVTQTTAPPGTPHDISTLIVNVINTDEDGNMAFGTNNVDPSYRLSINGSLKVKEVVVETGWADYVFDENYSLRSLKETEDYIVKNKHLPDVPSDAEVEKNGVEVGKTEALLLKKIEELTLYLIKQQKEIDQLKKNATPNKSK